MTLCVTWMPCRGLARATGHHNTRRQSIPARQSVVGDRSRMKYGISIDSNLALTRASVMDESQNSSNLRTLRTKFDPSDGSVVDASPNAFAEKSNRMPHITDQGRRHRALVFQAEIGVLQHSHRRSEAELVLRCHPSQRFQIPLRIRKSRFSQWTGMPVWRFHRCPLQLSPLCWWADLSRRYER